VIKGFQASQLWDKAIGSLETRFDSGFCLSRFVGTERMGVLRTSMKHASHLPR
jgi:hypothetical protein